MDHNATLKKHLTGMGQGTWYMGDEKSKRAGEIDALRTGIELGLTVIDTAEMYGDGRSEKLVGEAIADCRDKVFLISKVLPNHASRKGTRTACEHSLERLRTDVIDLYLLHWQGRYSFAETIDGMMDLLEAGKIRSWGVSNMDVAEMEEIVELPNGDTCLTNEILYNLSRRGTEYDLLPWCEKNSIPVIAYSPVEQGRILGDATLEKIAKRKNATPAQIALAWVMRNKNIIAIPKVSSADHVQENAKARDIKLDDTDVAELDKAFPPPKHKMELEVL